MTLQPTHSSLSLQSLKKIGSGHENSLIDTPPLADAQADLSLPWAHNHIVGFVASAQIRFL